MPPITTPALILHGFKYGETSKIVRLLTPHYGVQSAIAKGALRPRSRFGAMLQLLSEGRAELYMKQGRELHTLAEFDVTRSRPALARDVARYAAGVALAELVMRFAPSESHPEIYEHVVEHLDRLADVPRDQVDAVALSALWGTVVWLGFGPSLESCARDGRPLPSGKVAFSITDGGFLCAGCARGRRTTSFAPPHRAELTRLIMGPLETLEALPAPHAAAHRRLLMQFVERHVAENRELKALTFWEGLT